jgi:ABC-type uncharacterized transport system substrate-binding protein
MKLAPSALPLRWLKGCATGFIALAAMATTALGHPHVSIDNRADIVLDDEGRIVAINVEWKFDEMYSLVAVEGLDGNGDGIYQSDEIHPLARENIEALREYSYFVDAKANGARIEFDEVTEYGNLFNNGVLTLYFRVPLKEPIDPASASFSFAVYDPTYYIAILLAEPDPIQIIGTLKEGCGLEIRKSAAEAENYQYSEDFWDQAQDNLGAMFAQTIALKCGEGPKQAASTVN